MLERGMTASGIVPAFDEVDDSEGRVGLRAEVLPIEQLALEGPEEALAQRVVVRVADRTHGRPDAGLATPLAEGHRGVLAALIRVMNDVRRPTLRDGHLQRGQDELSPEMGFHRPADHASAPDIEDDGEIEEAGPGRHVGDVRDPQLIRARAGELAVDEIRRRPGRLVAHRRAERLPPAHALQPGAPHQPGHPLTANVEAAGGELGMNPGDAVGPARLAMDRLGGGLEVLAQLLWRSSLPHQLSEPLPKVWRVRSMALRHRGRSFPPQLCGVHETGATPYEDFPQSVEVHRRLSRR